MKKETLEKVIISEWLDPLEPFVESKDFDDIISFIKQEKAQGKKIVPNTQCVFQAYNKCLPSNVKVVMGLQDPYNTIEPDGLAMSCSNTGRPQPSLVYVHKEIRRTVKDYSDPQPIDLSVWAEQGVFLINSALTVQWGKPNSHQGKWDKFLDYTFYDIINKNPDPIVYIMLGQEAIGKFSKYARLQDFVLKAKHPASASYNSGYWDCENVFNKANSFLELNGKTRIKW